MAGEEAAAALFLALAVGGGAIAASHMVQERQIKEATQSVASHKHLDLHKHTENLATKSDFTNLSQEMWAGRQDHSSTRYDYETGLYVGHPWGLQSYSEHQAGRQRVVPAYKMRRGRRTVLPARIANNHESNYFYDRLNMPPGSNRTNWPNYDHPKYLMYAAESEEGRTWVTMEDLAQALEALNGKVEEYRNAIVRDMKEYGHLHPYDPGYEGELMQ